MTTTTNNPQPAMYHIIILDESGSMSSVYDAALTGTNEVLQAIGSGAAKHTDIMQQIQLVTFDSLGIKQRIPLQQWQDGMALQAKDYQPGQMTPLYDAIGATLTPLEAQLANSPEAAVSVTIITDGYENASQEYDAAAISALIGRLREKGWHIVFMGANVDVEEISLQLNIRHKMRFSSSDESARKAFSKISEIKEERINFYGARVLKKGTDLDKETPDLDLDLRDEDDKQPKQ